jgi:limonene 1,2-monooxygenase
MEFGFFSMPEHAPGEALTVAYDRDIENVVFAEKLGFDEYWFGEHHTGGFEPMPSPELMIAKASGLTNRIRLGTGTVNLPYHDPFLVAERLAFLDHLTHGRLNYGLGGGGLATDRVLFQLPGDEVSPRMNEAIDIISKLLVADGPLDYEGVYWKYNDRLLQVGPYQQIPPIAIAGLTSMNSFQKCGQNGWSAMSSSFTPVNTDGNRKAPDLRQQGAAIAEAAATAGRDPEEARRQWKIVREVYVSDSREQALEEIHEGATRFFDYVFGVGLGALVKVEADMPDEKLTVEYLIESSPWIFGTPEDCVDQIRDLHDQVGGFGTLLLSTRDWVTTDRWNRSLELFARRVAPHFRSNQYVSRRQQLADVALNFAKS